VKRWVIASLFLFGCLLPLFGMVGPFVAHAQTVPGAAEAASPGDLLVPAGTQDSGTQGVRNRILGSD
jgi:hypothetical protein